MMLLSCGYSRDEVAEFWRLVARGDKEECWMWMGELNTHLQDRAYIHFKRPGRKLYRAAARVAWEMTHGEIGDSLVLVCHHCDHPWCVNPNHLFIGSHKDNVQDSIRKGRHTSVLKRRKVGGLVFEEKQP